MEIELIKSELNLKLNNIGFQEDFNKIDFKHIDLKKKEASFTKIKQEMRKLISLNTRQLKRIISQKKTLNIKKCGTKYQENLEHQEKTKSNNSRNIGLKRNEA